MYRKDSGATGFSWGKLMTNSFPNFASDNPETDADLSNNEKDILWIHQVHGAETAGRAPMTLDAESAMKAGITPSIKNSTRIHKELVKNGTIDPSYPLGIDTTKVTSRLPHDLAFISVAAQRKVVGMLFFWEEEAIRWRLLEQEREEIEKAMEGATEEQMRKELGVRLQGVAIRKDMMPSRRAGEGAGSGTGGGNARPEEDGPPQYA